MTGSYNNFFRIFDCNSKKDITLEASKDNIKPRGLLKPKKVSKTSCCSCVIVIIFQVFQGTKKKKDEVLVDSLNYNKKVLHSAWHPQENIIGKNKFSFPSSPKS